MTLGEAKDKVYMLLDEHSAGGDVEHDEDIELKMVYFFDMAQKQLAQIKKIVKSRKISPESGKTEYPMPADFLNVCRVWRDGAPATNRFSWRGKKIVIPESNVGRQIVVDYFALPETIDADATDDYEFEIDEDAANCMPYYVAAQQLLPDLVMDYGGMLQMFNQAVSMLDTSRPGENGRLTQMFFRG
ncbi:MAG: hypothetical protein IJU18_05010 [Oscillospiraceae bacterium]|nr:hypothetical protein [Oscillospiraceae bacterium]